MAQNNVTPFWKYAGSVLRRAVTPFRWGRDLLIATGIALAQLLLLARWSLVADWRSHQLQWLLSCTIPYAVVLLGHLAYRVVEAPWRLHQEAEAEHNGTHDKDLRALHDSQADNSFLQAQIAKQTWPVDRPKLSFERWGALERGGVCQIQHGFYLANHGSTALEVSVDNLTIDETNWASQTLSAIEANQKGFVLFWKTGCLPGHENKWQLDDALRAVAARTGEGIYSPDTEIEVGVKYRDFDGNWYRTTCTMKRITSTGAITFGPPTQAKLIVGQNI